ncbi:MAG: hypothetical protein ACFFE8_04180 [Candidatus Heimdallarchaeota archaeon]
MLFSQISLMFIRMIGLGVGLDFLLVRRKKRFNAQVWGWLIYSFASLSQFLAQFAFESYLLQIFRFLFGVSTLIGSFLISVSIIVYFHPIEPKSILFMTILLIILPLGSLSLFGLEESVTSSILGSFLIIAGLYIAGIIKGTAFKQEVGQSVKWFYLLIASGIIQMILYIFFIVNGIDINLTSQNEDPFAFAVINSVAMAITVLTVILLIHLENSRSNLYSFKLKDTYSHNLANLIQVLVSGMHIIESETAAESEKEKTMELLERNSEEILRLLQEIRTLE